MVPTHACSKLAHRSYPADGRLLFRSLNIATPSMVISPVFTVR